MPAIARFAATASRGYGEFGQPLNLITESFTSSTTWTAPLTVSNVVTLSGKGGPGVSDYTQGAVQVLSTGGVVDYSPGEVNAVSPQYFEDFYDYAASFVTTMNTGSGVSTITLPFGIDNSWRIYPDNYNYRIFSLGSMPSGGQTYTYVKGTATLVLTRWGTGLITYANSVIIPSIYTSFTEYVYGSVGTAATGLSRTFPGGAYVAPTGYPASTTTFSNVAVTPGASYSLVIPAGGQISISYYA